MNIKDVYSSTERKLGQYIGMDKAKYLLPALLIGLIALGYYSMSSGPVLYSTSPIGLYRCSGATLQKFQEPENVWVDITTCGGALQVCDPSKPGCVTIECKMDTDCNDYDLNTVNKCIDGGTKLAKCSFERVYKQAP